MNPAFAAASRQTAAILAQSQSAALCRDAATPGFMEKERVRSGFHWTLALSWGAASTASFHLAMGIPALSGLIVLFLFSLLQLTGLRTARHAFRCGAVIGLAVYAPHLAFFWTIFNWAAVALWGVLAFWLGLFVVLARAVHSFVSNEPAVWPAASSIV